MDKLVKAMKVIRLKDEDLGQYLTASDDQVSVIVTTPNSQNYNPKNTEWRLEWLKGPKNLDGQVRLFSIYNKALTFTAKDDPADYCNCSSSSTTVLTQLPWPPPSSDVGEAAASEWRFVLRNKKNGVLVGDLLKWSEKCGQNFALNATVPNLYNTNLIFSIYSEKGFFKWLNLSSWIIEVVVKGDDNVVLTPSIVSQKISTSHNKAANSLDHTNLRTSLKQKTVITPLDEQPMVHSNNICKSSDVGLFGDHFTSKVLSRCQVGQIIFNVTPTSSAGFHTTNGQYTNSGGNVNGSGVQKNGDVSLYSEINRSRDNNVKFVSYGYD